ncbi:MAG: patatin-like phospholipase family protein [Cyanobium sp. PLM2.Bin73]|nr:MAG: patatin-like phospholipase family protein [Cyanobium sp. PLM2.Bin73]
MSAAGSQSRPGGRYLGLSFSGGGYRAALFSLGTLALLKDLGLLGKTAVLSGVSGGSIALGAYLCAKAGAASEIHGGSGDEDSWFYEGFYTPFLHYLSTEEMAQGFVHLSWLLQDRKLIKAAADANDRLFSQLLGEPALLGSDRIRALLNNEQCSPDYAFFNAADISSLNLFRFGLQKHRAVGVDSGANEVAVVVGRWILTPGPYRNPTRELYRYSKQLRLADCVAASHAFPLGLEPMVFPCDFFPPGQEGAKANAAFSGSEVCERKTAVGLLDGGLYDNLGLAGVEDIRELLNKERQASGSRASVAPQASCFVVIATDVDNIQPSLSFYDATQTRQEPTNRPPRLWHWLVYGLIAVVVAWLAITFRQWTVMVLLLLLGLLLLVLPNRLQGQLKVQLRKSLEVLSFTDVFVEQRQGQDMKGFSNLLKLGWLIGGWPPLQNLWQLLATLHFNLRVQRAGQAVPMFSGYLKRTRSLTYGYMQTKYRDERKEQRRGDTTATPHLVRNMIFELTQGVEADPDYASDLITLPVQKFSALNEEQEEVYRETSVMRKVRHAHLAAGLILQQQETCEGCGDERDPSMPGAHPCLLAIWKAGTAHDGDSSRRRDRGDQELDKLIEHLNLFQAAQLWGQLWEALRVGPGRSEPPRSQMSSSQVHELLTHTCMLLEGALRAPEICEGSVLENCRITPEPVPTHYSWIPLICEMATNLPTTLWIEGYRYYTPNRIVDGRVETPGAWFSRRPEAEQLKGRPLLDLRLGHDGKAGGGNGQNAGMCPAAAITTLAGYITTVFNLLEYYYSCLDQSQSWVNGLARTLTSQQTADPVSSQGVVIDTSCQQALLDLPFALRREVCRQLKAHAEWLKEEKEQPLTKVPRWIDQPLLENLRKLQDVQAQLDLLRPWLHSRGPFPYSWWSECREQTNNLG